MGVPSFFAWVCSMCKDYTKYLPKNIQEDDLREQNHCGRDFDTFFIDFNGIVHNCSHPAHDVAPVSEAELFDRIFAQLDHYINYVRPRKLVYIAVDGVCPFAKIVQQRKRRYISARGNSGTSFDSNCITPGTPFMERLSVALHAYVTNRMDTNLYWSSLSVILSNPNVPGEGEHKIFDFLRKESKNTDFANLKHCVYGMDADLIMLTLASNLPFVYIIREEMEFTKPNIICDVCHLNHRTNQHGKPVNLILCDPNVLSTWLITECAKTCEMKMEDISRVELINDFVLITFLVGNDFLPKIPSLKVQSGGMEIILKYYWPLFKEGKRLTNGININLHLLKEMFAKITTEESELLKMVVRTTKKSQEVKQYDAGLYFDSADTIMIHTQGYHTRYYDTHFGKANNTENFYKQIVGEYIEGLFWVFQYYTVGVPSWRWFYPEHYAPFAEDIYKYIDLNQEGLFEPDEPILPMEQLISVLPPQSFNNIPSTLASLVVSKQSPILNYFNTTFRTDINGEAKLFKGVPQLDFIDLSKIEELVAERMAELKGREMRRNSRYGENLLYFTTEGEYSEIMPLFLDIQVKNFETIQKVNEKIESNPETILNEKEIGCLELTTNQRKILLGKLLPVVDTQFFVSPKLEYLLPERGFLKKMMDKHVVNAYFRLLD
ncbi:5'-_3' exoribonuclease, putative [Entamoeba invadens IP1]|uniref:5'->3' exoribonuclease, putative n=1 Tax=Entamoeba invadens IP1 TaxID=370355 RepID=A0A0A1UAI0_ENTIV|nr:5'->3' exoribonuclease, putative [Entamoeba invadens IP1]ELP92037.1 5'->3' exoribonuclease, putative [Entamoeba invadens IP1]|eukprot:XP_004258808.1 5'-_3' exoribonuclease, putative [Entamoeba invadens IP1]